MKTYKVSNGPLTIGNIPPQRKVLDDNGDIQTIPAGTVWFDKSGLYSTDDPDQQAWLEKHPEVTEVTA